MAQKHCVTRRAVTMGCDPEFFFIKGKKVVGSEKVLDIKNGLTVVTSYGENVGKIVCDGVQAELNPPPQTCRAILGSKICESLIALKKEIEKEGKSFKISFDPVVKITKKELDSLSEKSKVFGCAPSRSTDPDRLDTIPKADGYMKRAAGGHIHLGGKQNCPNAFLEPELLVNVLDVLVGNTCVLLDRDESNVERRKMYGRAGEYRLPAHGIEYRTLSNFWLKSYPLMSFVMSLSRLAVCLVEDSKGPRNFAGELLSLVDMTKIQKAINENDFDLAYENFNRVKEYLISIHDGKNSDSSYYDYPFTAIRTAQFEFVAKKGLKRFFKKSPMEDWMHMASKGRRGWEGFLSYEVGPIMDKSA